MSHIVQFFTTVYHTGDMDSRVKFTDVVFHLVPEDQVTKEIEQSFNGRVFDCTARWLALQSFLKMHPMHVAVCGDEDTQPHAGLASGEVRPVRQLWCTVHTSRVLLDWA